MPRLPVIGYGMNHNRFCSHHEDRKEKPMPWCPICKNEYKNDVKKFEKYDRSYELLYDLLRLFVYYGVNVETPFSMTKPSE